MASPEQPQGSPASSRAELERRLELSEARFESVADTTSDAIIAADGEGRIVYLNDAAADMFGFPADDALQRPLATLIPERFRARYQEAFENLLRTGETGKRHAPVELVGRRAGGTEFPLELSLAAWSRVDGVFLTGIVRDISERKRLEEQLELREAQLAEAQAMASIGTFEWDIASDRIVWSQELYEIYGLDRHDFAPTRDRVLERVHPDDLPMVERQIERTLSGSQPVPFVHRIVRPEGSVRTLEVRLEGVAGPDSVSTTIIGVCRDITEQRRAAEDRREAEERFRLAFENAPIGMALAAPDGRFLQVNRHFCEITGYSKWALLSMDFQELTHPDELDDDRERQERLRRGEIRSYQKEKRYRHADGHSLLVRVSISLVRDENGEPLYFIGQVEDISARRRIEQALRESRDRLEAILENTPAGVYLKDLNGRYLLVNVQEAALAGRRPADFIGRTAHDLFPPEVAADRSAHDRDVLEAGVPVEREISIPVDGELRTYVAQKFLLRDIQGIPYAIGGISTDITEHVRIEEENRRLETSLHHADRTETIGRLAGGVAHDFNNLLAVILNYSVLAAEGLPEGSEARQDLAEIQKAAERAAALTQQLVALSRREPVEPRVIDLNAEVREDDRLLRRALGEDIQLRTELTRELWPVEADPDQMQRVVLNLAVNARDAMPGGGSLVISTHNVEVDGDWAGRLREPVAPGRYARLAVTDDGCGMSEEVLARAFDPFFTTKARGKGTGLGLATVDGVMRQAGGFAEIESSPERGTTVSVYLPASERAVRDEPPDQLAAAPEGGHGLRILVVEDEEAVRTLVVRVLSGHGYSVVAVPDAEAAMLEHEHSEGVFDLLLTDVVLPRMSGAELAKKLAERQPGLPVAFMSGYTADVLDRHVVDPAGAPLLGKPFKAAELLRCVSTALAKRPAQV